jgi:hypothetical protein
MSLAASRQSTAPPVPVSLEEEERLRRNLQEAFGIEFSEDQEEQHADANDEASREARLARNLRAAGII